MKNILTLLLVGFTLPALSQTGIGTTTPDASAQLDVVQLLQSKVLLVLEETVDPLLEVMEELVVVAVMAAAVLFSAIAAAEVEAVTRVPHYVVL